MMKRDTSRYDCTEACGFKGDQLEILSHLEHCPKRLERCGDCEEYFPKDQVHDASNCSAYTTCPSCSQRIKTSAFREHVVQVHGGHHCRLCKKESMLSPTDHKANECTYREPCGYCDKIIPARHTTDHYKIHHDFFMLQKAYLEKLVEMMDDNVNQNFYIGYKDQTKRQLKWFRKELRHAECEIYLMRKFFR